jgi:hypothetical protein
MSGTLYVPLKADFYEDPKIIRAGEAAELLYVHMLAYCSRTFTDGFIDDAQLARLGLKRVEKRAATLAQHALISRVDDSNSHGYRVTAWLKHNPSVKEIAKAHEQESTAGKRGNHLRWHVQQGLVVEGCPWCKSCDSIPESDRVPDRGPDGSESGAPNRPESQDTETDTASSSATATATAPDPIPASNHKDAELLLRHWCVSKSKPPRIPNRSGAVETIVGFLEDGHSVSDMTFAMADSPVISINALNIGLDKLAKKRSYRQRDIERGQAECARRSTGGRTETPRNDSTRPSRGSGTGRQTDRRSAQHRGGRDRTGATVAICPRARGGGVMTDDWQLMHCDVCHALESDPTVHLVVDPGSDDVIHIAGLVRCGVMVAPNERDET